MAKEPKRIYLDPNILAYVANTKAPQQAAFEFARSRSRSLPVRGVEGVVDVTFLV